MNSLDGNSIETLIKALCYIADCIQFYERVSKQPCCNSCREKKTCNYRPDWGEPTRINCPLWQKDGD